MSELAESGSTPSDLPRLRIHHFFVLTTVFSIVMSAHLGLWRFLRSSQPDGVMPEISGGISVLLIIQMLSVSVCIAIAMLGLAWRRQGFSFPSQPGHWVAIYLAIVWVYEVVNYVTTFVPTFGIAHEIMAWVRMAMHFAFHCFAALLWIAAYLREDSRIWRWGWAAMALRSAIVVSFFVLRIGVKCIEWLLETFWYNSFWYQSQYDLQLLPFLGSFSIPWSLKMWVSSYALLVFLAATMISDYRHSRRRHWSHWLVLISTFVSTAALAFYYHWVLYGCPSSREPLFPEMATLPIIRSMPRWTPHSNVADVLSLGPRTAGQLMRVGVRTVAELLVAKPQAVARRVEIRSEILELWQREARLVLEVPRLPSHAARIFAAIGYSGREKISRCTPTELLGDFEMACEQGCGDGWLEKNSPPTISELATWIRCAQSASDDLAA